MNDWLEYLGRWHVALIHFPIGLLVTAALVEFVATCRRFKVPSTSAVVMVCCGALGAVVASVLGWVQADQVDHPGAEEIVEFHRWCGIVSSVLAMFTAGLGWTALRGSPALRWPFRVFLLITAVVVVLTANRGGALIYGDDYYDLPGSDAAAEVEDISEE